MKRLTLDRTPLTSTRRNLQKTNENEYSYCTWNFSSPRISIRFLLFLQPCLESDILIVLLIPAVIEKSAMPCGQRKAVDLARVGTHDENDTCYQLL